MWRNDPLFDQLQRVASGGQGAASGAAAPAALAALAQALLQFGGAGGVHGARVNETVCARLALRSGCPACQRRCLCKRRAEAV